MEQVSRFYHQLQDERHVASSGRIDALLRRTSTDRLPELVEDPILRTFAAIEYLGKLVPDILAADPHRAKVIAELEISLIENLPPNTYHPVTIVQLRSYAWRDLGMVLRILGQLQESLDAFATAERDLHHHGALRHDIALVRLSVSATLQELERFEEARKLIGQSKRIFGHHGDDKRLVLATITEAVLLQRMKLHREAREIYRLLLSSGVPLEIPLLAAIHRGIGFASTELGDYADAEVNLIRSIHLNLQLAQPVEVIRGQYAFGRLLVRRGDVEKAIAYLRPVRREFLQNALTEEAGLCGLEIVEALLTLGKYSTAETLARRIISEFSKAGLNKRAITALGYLKEALAASNASTALVKTVRDYIVSLRTSPKRDFLPLYLTVSREPD
ncbi:MAG TPA: hypothetical protein VEO54_30640 [Thermoanaerobaculia bacterium]|nr:hypothetical protein [Thermoanaerobaculia bacterium]